MTGNDRQEPSTWGTPAEEYRAMAKDCAAMGRPDLAVGFLSLAEEEERHKHALAALFGAR